MPRRIEIIYQIRWKQKINQKVRWINPSNHNNPQQYMIIMPTR